MRVALAVAAILIFAQSAFAVPGDPRAVRGTLEWPTTLSGEQFIVVRGDDGRTYYADVSGAQRTSAGSISGRISLLGVEGNQAHEIAAVMVGPGDSALAYATPPATATTQPAPPAPSSLAREAVPAASPSAPAAPAPPVPAAASSANPDYAGATSSSDLSPAGVTTDDLWQVRGKVTAVTPKEFVVETRPGESVRVDVSKLSAWTRETVRAGDEVKLFGVPQKDHRLVANGFIQEVQPGGGSR